MPYIKRNKEGDIVAIYDSEQQGAVEMLSPTDPAVTCFLNSQGASEAERKLGLIRQSDLGMGRVVEDLIEVLIEKRVIAITDLPSPAIERLRQRKSLRQKLSSIGQIFDSDDLNT